MAKRRKLSAGAFPTKLLDSRKNDGPIDLTLSDVEDAQEEDTKPEAAILHEEKTVYNIIDDSSDTDDDGVTFVRSESKILNGSNGKKTINDILKDKVSLNNTSAPSKGLPPLLLSTPAAVEKHTPCTLTYDILPPSLAERLYRVMLLESEDWQRNRWYLADRLVESPHRTAFYSADSSVDGQWYMGRKEQEKQRAFLPEMLEAKRFIEEYVNDQLRRNDKRQKRKELEFDGPWKANVCAANCYKGGAETVGYHADQLTYLGPYPTIASLSLGTTRNFRLRGVATLQDPSAPPPRTYDIQLPHNSLCIMGAGCQERFKHTIPPARGIDVFKLKIGDHVESHIERINITFRFYRPDFLPDTTPVCHCGIPTVLKADAKGKAAANASNANGDTTSDGSMRFFWMCFAGAQNEGKKCNFFKLLDMKGERRGPCIRDRKVEEPSATT